ncbi:MAG TPA: hypothetical protein VF469_35715 [Kofleriaceae bacterium]
MISRIVVTGLGLAILAACALEPDVGPRLAGTCNDTDTAPRTSVSFSQDIRPLIVRPTGGCSCHLPSSTGAGTGTQLAGLDLSSFASLRAGGFNSGDRVVVAGEPCASIMYQKLSDSPPFGSRMPLNGPPFWSPDELRLLHDWIAEGASDN